MRFFNPDLAGGALLDIGVYALAACRYFLSAQPKVIGATVVKAPTGVDEESLIMLKNNHNELASVNLAFRAKMPKQCIVALEEGYYTIPNYPRAEQATFTTHDGQVTTINAGNTNETFHYEQATIEKLIRNNQYNNEYIKLSYDVMQLMDNTRTAWNNEA